MNKNLKSTIFLNQFRVCDQKSKIMRELEVLKFVNPTTQMSIQAVLVSYLTSDIRQVHNLRKIGITRKLLLKKQF